MTGPCFILGTVLATPFQLLNRVGQHPGCPLIAELLDNFGQAFLVQMVAVVVLSYGFLNGILAVNVLQITGPPQRLFSPSAGLLRGIWVEILIANFAKEDRAASLWFLVCLLQPRVFSNQDRNSSIMPLSSIENVTFSGWIPFSSSKKVKKRRKAAL